jgi:Cu-Zn family superoxide dismutase
MHQSMIAAPALAALLLAGCASGSAPSARAVAELQPTRGSNVSGQVEFVQQGDVMHVSGTVRGLPPNSEHGFHIHEKGDCSSGDGMSAGGHFNPMAATHGRFGQPGAHAGDLPSLHADASGVATFSVDDRSAAVGSGPADVVGRGLIVHRDPDDYLTQPTGNAGPRLACAVITRR